MALDVVTSDNGTPWKAIRIYNWKMYEKLDTESVNIPMAKVAARSLGNNKVQVGFAGVPAEQPLPFMIIQILKLRLQPWRAKLEET